MHLSFKDRGPKANVLHVFQIVGYTVLYLEAKCMAESFTPITKEEAARICSVSLRTINTWIEAGELPTPVTIASGRRLYWHPDVFYAWLNKELGATLHGVSTNASSPRRRGRPRNAH
jgi:hypothetical protein